MRRRIHPYSSVKRHTPHVIYKGLIVVYILLYSIYKVMLTIYRQLYYYFLKNINKYIVNIILYGSEVLSAAIGRKSQVSYLFWPVRFSVYLVFVRGSLRSYVCNNRITISQCYPSSGRYDPASSKTKHPKSRAMVEILTYKSEIEGHIKWRSGWLFKENIIVLLY